DFFTRLESNYTNLSQYQRVLLEPIDALPDSLYSLFANGYKLTDSDKEFLKSEFKIELEKESKKREMEIIYYLSLTIFYIKLKTMKNMFLLPKMERLFCSILSFKVKKVIGYSFNNLIQVAHH